MACARMADYRRAQKQALPERLTLTLIAPQKPLVSNRSEPSNRLNVCSRELLSQRDATDSNFPAPTES
ncbi:predicted protein [Plenodomus lingam JN3]|uniref:Predicted protein n=1 Tax=Leptosphaeria maculans (strain JN3 / isolate v23.1.3 / race Av1-4-5-6-7-8) TaxID=985895 RepID=E5AB40_LEPMJ|nr:predicted protein [Plenodomus lingam JN3]CBY00881.1 predicted protein [Plenodomus lingam JN3]